MSADLSYAAARRAGCIRPDSVQQEDRAGRYSIVRIRYRRFDLALKDLWAIAHDGGPRGGKTEYPVVFLELEDDSGRRGLGEASPSSQYGESHATVTAFLDRVDASRLTFDDPEASMAYVASLGPGNFPARCAVDLALLDGAARARGQTVREFLGLAYPSSPPLTSFTIGLDEPEVIAAKVTRAMQYPRLKMKVGDSHDRENLAALRSVSPDKVIRVDANAAWKTRERALQEIERLALDGKVEFVEQPMPASMPLEDWKWLADRSPLPLFADESYQSAADAGSCSQWARGVNVKLVKTGGLLGGKRALEAARVLGMETMLGCMIESSVLISAAAQLASLATHLDLDGNLLITNDPFEGVRCIGGRLTFDGVRESFGLQVSTKI